MAFDSLQSLGEEKFRAVVQKLLAGTRESSVAKLIQEQWLDCQHVLENTLIEELPALHEAASIKTPDHGDVEADNRSFLQLRDSELGCLEKVIHAAIATWNGMDSMTKNGGLTASESRIVIALMKLHMQQIAMIHDMKLDIGLNAYKRGMVTGEEDAEDFLRRYHAKCGRREESRTDHESASSSSSPPSAMSDEVGQEQGDEVISAASWALLEELESYPTQPWQ